MNRGKQNKDIAINDLERKQLWDEFKIVFVSMKLTSIYVKDIVLGLCLSSFLLHAISEIQSCENSPGYFSSITPKKC